MSIFNNNKSIYGENGCGAVIMFLPSFLSIRFYSFWCENVLQQLVSNLAQGQDHDDEYDHGTRKDSNCHPLPSVVG